MSRNTTGTAEEKAIHKAATKLRKMTDIQLVTAFREARENGKSKDNTVQQLIDSLMSGACPGIGKAIAGKIAKYAKDKSLI